MAAQKASDTGAAVEQVQGDFAVAHVQAPPSAVSQSPRSNPTSRHDIGSIADICDLGYRRPAHSRNQTRATRASGRLAFGSEPGAGFAATWPGWFGQGETPQSERAPAATVEVRKENTSISG